MQCSRRGFLQSLGASIAAAGLAPELLATDKGSKRPNIIFFLVDDMGWQDTSLPFYYRDGKPVRTRLNKRYSTPFMEQMGAEGMILTSGYAQPICSPTRCSILSGMNSARHRVTNWTDKVDGSKSNNKGPQGGIARPNWAVNGIQPLGTKPTGTTKASYNVGGVAYPDTASYEYSMKSPYTIVRPLPEFLKSAGYTTFLCGKAHFASANGFDAKSPTTPGQNPRLLGFDYNLCGSHKGQPSSYRADNTGDSWGGEIFGLKKIKRPNKNTQAMLTETLTTEAIELVQQKAVRSDKPFFLYLGQFALHLPIANKVALDKERIVAEDPAADRERLPEGDDLPWNQFERNYRDLVNGMDTALGQVLAWANQVKASTGRDTVIVFMGDNGGLVGKDQRSAMAWNVGNAPLAYGKGSCYEGGFREPMLAWSTNKSLIPAGQVSHIPVICEDLFPTFLDYAGVDIDALRKDATKWAKTPGAIYGTTAAVEITQQMDGVSLKRLFQSGAAPTAALRPILIHQPNPWTGTTSTAYDFFTAMRYGDWKLVYQHDSQAFELYNLEQDISETTNLAAQQLKRVDTLRKIMGKTLRDRGAQMPIIVATNKPVPYPDQGALVQTPQGLCRK